MDKKLVCVDIDGTLVNKEGKVPDFNKVAIKKAIEQGHIICLTTARPWRSTRKIYDEVGIDTMVANYNGGLVHHPLRKDIKDIETKIPTDVLLELLDHDGIKEKIHSFILENKKAVFISKEDTSAMEQYQVKEADIMKIGESYEDYMHHGATGCLILVKNQYDPLEVRAHMQEIFGDKVAINYWVEATEGVVIDLANKETSKGKALMSFAKHYGISQWNTIAIGDSWNDVSMFHAAGKGIAMHNANAETRAEASYVSSKSNDRAGVGYILNKELKLGLKYPYAKYFKYKKKR